ncbi:E3 binding domain-containing protein [Pseudomonas aeruginosa]|nr:E3 binding domain-containing protein [Pseudomonas aeruginosa]
MFNAYALKKPNCRKRTQWLSKSKPQPSESVADGTVATWHKKPGEAVKRDELIVDIETDKVVTEVLAEADGVLAEIIKNEGDTVLSNELLGKLNEGRRRRSGRSGCRCAAPPLRLHRPPLRPPLAATTPSCPRPARKLAEEAGIDPNSIAGTGKGGRVTKEDVVAAVEAKKNAQPPGACRPGCRGADLRRRRPCRSACR